MQSVSFLKYTLIVQSFNRLCDASTSVYTSLRAIKVPFVVGFGVLSSDGFCPLACVLGKEWNRMFGYRATFG